MSSSQRLDLPRRDLRAYTVSEAVYGRWCGREGEGEEDVEVLRQIFYLLAPRYAHDSGIED